MCGNATFGHKLCENAYRAIITGNYSSHIFYNNFLKENP